ncbi:ATP synthase subunit alpha 1 [Nymphon striatum]|nr:ATP synthase subunit alpha 1 [Nymphon striatum]
MVLQSSQGLERALSDELLEFSCGVQGIVLDLEPDRLGVVLLGASDRVTVGESVMRSHKVVSTKVGDALLGRVVNSLGEPLDGKGAVKSQDYRAVEAEAPQILEREAISRPLATGIKIVDAAVPVGLGQRQLVIGDRQTGKTSLAVDAILNQKHTDVICIYCAIGQRGDAVAKVIGAITDADMMKRTVIISAGDEDAAGLAYIAPYAALTIAESFSDHAAEAMVTENAARLALMQQAEQSVDEKLEELQSETRALRQADITTELLDVIIGFEALKKKRPRQPKSETE